jgi:signal transduction histidine kinase
LSTAIISSGNDLPPALLARQGGRHFHTAQFYAESQYLLDELNRYIGTSLQAGDSAVVIATKEHRDNLAQRLRSSGVDLSGVIQQGRYIALDAADTLRTFMVDGMPDAALFTQSVGIVLERAINAAAKTNPHISAFGEMVALLWQQGNPEAAIQLEQLWNEIGRLFPMSLHCGYPISVFDREDHGDLFLKTCAQHSHVIPVESYTGLDSDQQRLLQISFLQQKARALETEVAERKKVEEALRCSQAQLESMVEQRTKALRQLSSRLLTMQDTERRRIARELHDSLGQYLVALKLNLEMLKRSSSERLWLDVDQLMQQCISEVRTLSYLLHPPTMDAAGFASAARWYVEGFGQRSGVKVTLDLPENLGRLRDAIELALFRVLQEALTNVHRHSGASEAQVSIRQDAGQVILEIKDNGRGISEELLTHFYGNGSGMGVGLAGIRERTRELGGVMEVESDKHGTLVRASMPDPRSIQK